MSTRIYLFLFAAVVSSIPIMFFGLWPHSKALDLQIDEVAHRHLVLAKNVSLALKRYDRDLKSMFRLGASQAIAGLTSSDLSRALEGLNIRHICVADVKTGSVLYRARTRNHACPAALEPMRLRQFTTYGRQGEVKYTPVESGKGGLPVVHLVLKLRDQIAIGTIDTSYFQDIASTIEFDKGGHAAIVDHYGRVLAHPNRNWVLNSKDISKVPPVKLMLDGGTGVSRFHSPATNTEMIAGYATVSGPAWGVMIPQPMHELVAKAQAVNLFSLAIILSGLFLAALAAWWFSGVIAQPVLAIAKAAQDMALGYRGVQVANLSDSQPREITQLARTFNRMSKSIQLAMQSEQDMITDLRALFLASPAATFLLDHDRRFRLVSKQFENWFGLQQSQVTGKTESEVFCPAILDRLRPALDGAFLRGEHFTIELNAALADDHDRSIVAHIFPIVEDDERIIGLGGILLDITAQKVAEERLHQAQKLEVVGQLASGVAHDFNNLLMVIKSKTRLLSDRTPDHEDLIAPISRATDLGTSLTRRLLAYSRMQQLQPRSIDLRKLVKETNGILQHSVGSHIRVIVDTPQDLWKIYADPAQVQTALMNLALNARDAMPSGGTLTIKGENCSNCPETVEVSPGKPTSRCVKLTVSDTGTGMPEEVQARAFEPFFTTKEAGAGSGLGLSMVYGFAKQTGGHVRLQSVPGEGTCIELLFPRALNSSIKSDLSRAHAHKDVEETD